MWYVAINSSMVSQVIPSVRAERTAVRALSIPNFKRALTTTTSRSRSSVGSASLELVAGESLVITLVLP